MGDKTMESLCCPEEDYTISELLEELMQDESWEQDEEYRRKAIGMLSMNVFTFC